MKRKSILLMGYGLAALIYATTSLGAQSQDLAKFFPDIAGWQKKGAVDFYFPETLYKYINGAAENFLSYDFKELAVQNYANTQGQSLTAEIYFHGTVDNAFGIYSSEKPAVGQFLELGSQGYSEAGVLNFLNAAYYVKLNGFDLVANDADVLLGLARKIAVAIGSGGTLPELLRAFPAAGKVANSERFILNNFLGHAFLQGAYVADYDLEQQKFQLFIMQAKDENGARAMLQKYAALDKEIPAPEIKPGALTIRDPYNGSVQLFWRGSAIWGVIGQTSAAAACIEAIDKNLQKQ